MKLDNPVLKIDTPAERAEDITFFLEEAGALAIEERDGKTMCTSEHEQVTLIAGFENSDIRDNAHRAITQMAFEGIRLTCIDEMADDWRIKWREFFKPVVLEKLQVITPWMTPPRVDRQTIVIDPGQAFGTGGHATTKLVLEYLETLVPLQNPILDVGTGSGILAFAAALLGAKHITGVDIDPESKVAFNENMERNGLTNHGLTCRIGSADDVEGTFPLVLANIQIDAFRVCHTAVANRTAPGGTLIISGILTEQVDELLTLFNGFELTSRRDDGEWVALLLTRQS